MSTSNIHFHFSPLWRWSKYIQFFSKNLDNDYLLSSSLKCCHNTLYVWKYSISHNHTIKEFNVGQSVIKCESLTFWQRIHNSKCAHIPTRIHSCQSLGGGGDSQFTMYKFWQGFTTVNAGGVDSQWTFESVCELWILRTPPRIHNSGSACD